MNATECLNKIRSARKALCAIDDYTINKLIGNYAGLCKRFCPFKVGNRVRLTETPVITKETAHGWLGSKHFLVAGALGTVKGLDCYEGWWTVGVVWDDETWIHHVTGEKMPMDRPCIYNHSERVLRLKKDAP